MSANLDGLLFCAQAVHGDMRETGGGAIVTVSSVTVELGAAGALHYVTSKAGIVGFTRALAREVGGEGIRVNCVMPGAIRTEAELEQFPDQDALAAEQAAVQSIPRRGLPEDLVGAVVFLCSRRERLRHRSGPDGRRRLDDALMRDSIVIPKIDW